LYSPSIGAPERIVSPTEVLPVDLVQTFAVGQRLQGEVVRVVPPSGVLVNFAGQPMLLALAQQVAPGQILTATVAQVSPALILHLADELPLSLPADTPLTLAPAPQEGHQGILTAAQLKTYLIAHQPFGETVTTLTHMLMSHPWLRDMAPALTQELRDTLAALHPQSELPPDAAQLKTQVDRSGLNYERKVQRLLTGDLPGAMEALAKDLKGQVLELSHRLELLRHSETDPKSREAATVFAQVQRAVDALEFQQLLNQFALQEHRPLVLPLVLPFASPPQTMQLVIQREGHREGKPAADQEHYTVALSLDLSALGPLHIEAAVHGSAVSATFRVADPAVAEFLRAALPDLHARLQALGCTPGVACTVQEPVTQDSEGCLPRSLTRAVKLVDIKV
jgi:Flagellar hook-length control protein FliK